ncbi:MAG: HEAT repeat domain-containing protein [Planctomycetales bacterium]|nr:HEAT repeat domain-containing protein [Planctomycetales bacterium]
MCARKLTVAGGLEIREREEQSMKLLTCILVVVACIVSQGCSDDVADEIAVGSDLVSTTRQSSMPSAEKQKSVTERAVAAFEQAFEKRRADKLQRQTIRIGDAPPPLASGKDSPLPPVLASELELTEEESRAILSLVKAIDSDNQKDRINALMTLERAGPKSWPARDTVVKAARDQDFYVWTRAIGVLGSMGPDATPALTSLFESFGGKIKTDDSETPADDLQKMSQDLAKSLGKSLGQFVQTLNENRIETSDESRRDSAARRIEIVKAMSRIGNRSVPFLASALADEHYGVQIEAASQLGLFGAAAEPAVPALTDALAATDRQVKIRAAETLGKIGPSAIDSVDPIATLLLQSDDDWTRRAALTAMTQIGGKSIFMLGDALAVVNKNFADEILRALGGLGVEVIPTLEKSLYQREIDSRLRDQIARTLGSLGPSSVSALVKASRSDDEAIRRAAVAGLAALRWDAAPDLLPLLSDPDLSKSAATSIRRSEEAISTFEDLILEHPDFEVRMWAAEAYRQVKLSR